MKLTLNRFASGKDSTLGLLTCDDMDFKCFTCEDEFREVKVAGETRIPNGTYEIKLRNEGGMNEKYKTKYPNHAGMLHLQSVPGFEYVYIHCGNTDDDSLGCLLVGFGAEMDVALGGGYINRSVEAYKALYSRVGLRILKGEKVEIEIR